MGNDGRYYWTALQGIDSGWSTWQKLPELPHARGNAVITKTADNRFIAFAADQSGKVFVSAQRHAGSPSDWTSWQRVPTPDSDGGLAAMRNRHGQIELYLRDRSTRHLVRIVQHAPQASDSASPDMIRWAAVTDLGVSYVGKPAIGLDQDGEVLVAILERFGVALYG